MKALQKNMIDLFYFKGLYVNCVLIAIEPGAKKPEIFT